MSKKFISYTLITGIVTIIFGVIYATVQQSYRQSANDPQIAMAESIAASLSAGDKNLDASTAKKMVFGDATSLSPFIIVFDSSGVPVSSIGAIHDSNGKIIMPPHGVFEYFATLPMGQQDRITWQTTSGERYATVVTRYTAPNGTTGFVLVARSLREVEAREDQLGRMVCIAWMLSVIGLCVLFLIKRQ